MKLLLIAFVSLLFSSCTAFIFPKPVPVQGTYFTPPYIIESDKTFDQVWSNIIDFFAQNGLEIKVIDKTSGFIASGNSTQYIPTIEVKPGVLKSKTSYIVAPALIDPSKPKNDSKRIRPQYPIVYGQWNIVVKSVNGHSTINVNIVNIEYMGITGNGYTATTRLMPAEGTHSTGVFEKSIADAIK